MGKEIKKYDKKGNLIYEGYNKKNNNTRYKYDKNNNCIYEERVNPSFPHKAWYEYDERNNCIYERFSGTGSYTWWKKYDRNNNCIYMKKNHGYEK